MDTNTFARHVAHDLKAPLNGIAAMIDFVVEDYGERLDEPGREQLRLLQAMSTRAVAMVDGLKTLAHVSTVPVRPRTVALKALAPRLLHRAADRVRDEAAVEAVVSPTVPSVAVDPALLPFLLDAVFLNAVVYSLRPTRRVVFDALRGPGRDVPDSHVALVVRDDGIGVPESSRETIFHMFRRLHAADRFGGGVGAGLAIARTIVERHGGAMWIDDSGEHGTSVAWTLPRATAGGEAT